MSMALQQAAALNPSLHQDKLGLWLVREAREQGETERVLGQSYRGQLHWGLSCGQHFKLCAAASITREEDLLCSFCTPEDVLRACNKLVMSRAEHSFAVQLHNAGKFAGVRFQARVVPQWQGAVDFYCPDAKLCIQVDDPHHFLYSIHGQDRAEILCRDVALNALCLKGGLSMLRLSHHELVVLRINAMQLLQQVRYIITEHPGCRLLVLSPFYGGVHMGAFGQYGVPWYVEECYRLLQAEAICQYMGSAGMQGTCHFFMI
jgi:very-short-patch-repair endonuclease